MTTGDSLSKSLSLGRLGPCPGGAVLDVDARRKLVVTEARIESAVAVSSWRVHHAAAAVVDVLAETIVILIRGIAGLNAELVCPHKVMPAESLAVASAVDRRIAAESVREEERSKRVATVIGTGRLCKQRRKSTFSFHSSILHIDVEKPGFQAWRSSSRTPALRTSSSPPSSSAAMSIILCVMNPVTVKEE